MNQNDPQINLSDLPKVAGGSVTLFADEKSPLYWANLTAAEDIVINQGGTFSGKSFAIMETLITIACIKENYVITVISNTVTKLKEDAIRVTQAIFRKYPVLQRFLAQPYNITDRTYTFRTGSIIEFKSFETQEQAMGGKRHILYVNEAPRIPYMVFYQAQLRTTVRTFIDYNPTSQFWVHDKVINNKKEFPSVKVLRSWHIHNPHLEPKQRQRIENIQDDELFKVYARGLTGRLKGTVYPNWIPVENDWHWSDKVIWGCDWGYTNDPTALVRIALDPARGGSLPQYNGFDYVFDELTYTPGISSSALVTILKSQGYKAGQTFYCDHDTDMIRELRIKGIAAFPFRKGEGSILSGILFLRSKKIGYTKRSENTKVELKNYRFIEIDGHITNEPVDEYNHICDAVRGACHTNALRTGLV